LITYLLSVLIPSCHFDFPFSLIRPPKTFSVQVVILFEIAFSPLSFCQTPPRNYTSSAMRSFSHSQARKIPPFLSPYLQYYIGLSFFSMFFSFVFEGYPPSTHTFFVKGRTSPTLLLVPFPFCPLEVIGSSRSFSLQNLPLVISCHTSLCKTLPPFGRKSRKLP